MVSPYLQEETYSPQMGGFQEYEAEYLEMEITRGSRGYVRWVQQALNQLLGLRLATDGIMGTQTRSAIRSFQQRQGLSASGIIDPATERVLAARFGPPPNTSGSTGPAAGGGIVSVSDLSTLRANIVRVANQEWERWNIPRRKFERDPRSDKSCSTIGRPARGCRYRPAIWVHKPGSKLIPGVRPLFRG